MADASTFSPRRVVLVAAVAGAIVGGAVAGGVAAASASGNHDSPASSSSTGGSVTTAAVVRTNLSDTVQVGGSISFDGSYTIAAPSGTSASQLATAQQAVTQDEAALSSDEQTENDASATDADALATAQSNVSSATSTVAADKAAKDSACAGKGASTPACSQAQQKVTQDQQQLTQDQQQLTQAEQSETLDHDQNSAKVATDKSKLRADQATLTMLEPTAMNPGTTYTALPTVGEVIHEDQSVYALSNEPVPLLYGSVAAYRAFYDGMSDGADVGELTHDLIALGYGDGLAQSDHFSSATAAAIERWQQARHLPVTGEILLGEVVFEPGPIRVTTVTPTVGSSVGGGGGGDTGSGGGGGGTVLTATSTKPIVTVDLDVSDEYLVKPGDAVTVVLPNGNSTVGGRVQSVGDVATCPGGGGTGTGTGTGGTADQTPCSSTGSGGGSDSSPTVTMTISLNSSPSGARLDQAPVNVNITSQTADGVLAVPVSALLALQGGGYGVDVVDASGTHLVGVTTGLYSSTLVQISGSGITAGTKVAVPSS